MNYWDVVTKTGVTTVALCLTPESRLALWQTNKKNLNKNDPDLCL